MTTNSVSPSNFKLKKAIKKAILANLNTTLEPREVTFRGYTIRLIGLAPHRTSGVPINPGDYEATLIVTLQESK